MKLASIASPIAEAGLTKSLYNTARNVTKSATTLGPDTKSATLVARLWLVGGIPNKNAVVALLQGAENSTVPLVQLTPWWTSLARTFGLGTSSVRLSRLYDEAVEQMRRAKIEIGPRRQTDPQTSRLAATARGVEAARRQAAFGTASSPQAAAPISAQPSQAPQTAGALTQGPLITPPPAAMAPFGKKPHPIKQGLTALQAKNIAPPVGESFQGALDTLTNPIVGAVNYARGNALGDMKRGGGAVLRGLAGAGRFGLDTASSGYRPLQQYNIKVENKRLARMVIKDLLQQADQVIAQVATLRGTTAQKIIEFATQGMASNRKPPREIVTLWAH